MIEVFLMDILELIKCEALVINYKIDFEEKGCMRV